MLVSNPTLSVDFKFLDKDFTRLLFCGDEYELYTTNPKICYWFDDILEIGYKGITILMINIIVDDYYYTIRGLPNDNFNHESWGCWKFDKEIDLLLLQVKRSVVGGNCDSDSYGKAFILSSISKRFKSIVKKYEEASRNYKVDKFSLEKLPKWLIYCDNSKPFNILGKNGFNKLPQAVVDDEFGNLVFFSKRAYERFVKEFGLIK